MSDPRSINDLVQFSDEGPVTRKLIETDRTIVTLVCLMPAQAIPQFTHKRREAFVTCMQGCIRVTPGDGPAELHAGDIAFYDGTEPAGPSNPGDTNAAFLVTLVRKKDA